MQSRELAFIYFFIRCPYRTTIRRSPLSLLSRPPAPSHQLSSLYLIQLAGPADRDESFLFDSPFPIRLLFSLRFSLLVFALLIFILTCYTSYFLYLLLRIFFTSFWSFIFFLIYFQRSLCTEYVPKLHRMSFQSQILKIKLLKLAIVFISKLWD